MNIPQKTKWEFSQKIKAKEPNFLSFNGAQTRQFSNHQITHNYENRISGAQAAVHTECPEMVTECKVARNTEDCHKATSVCPQFVFSMSHGTETIHEPAAHIYCH